MKLRIHGDNIIECERALNLIRLAYQGQISPTDSDISLPRYNINRDGARIFEVELLGGHDLWNVNISAELERLGAPLREATDAYITKVLEDGSKEELLFAIEFCSALPAGNNAWQRNGRAVTCAEIGIPYFYFAEIGGVELDAKRKVKAPRFPNPIVPFSYLTFSESLRVVCIPIYQAHPAITDELREKFMHVFGNETSLELLKCIIDGSQITDAMGILVKKGTTLVIILSNDRSHDDTFRLMEWDQFLKIASGQQKAEWIKNNLNKQIWRKKSSGKVKVTKTFKKLLAEALKLDCLSIGAKDIPICLIANGNVKKFASILKDIYPPDEINDLANTIENKNKPFIVVWITGFKPRGDDSRPDRGLVPLARMLFGNDIDILTILYGPAGKKTWETFNEDPERLATDNGLWQAVIHLSNYVLADSKTSKYDVLTNITSRSLERNTAKVIFNTAKRNVSFSENDVDTTIHTLFSRQKAKNIFESMCNPPGGDWSGISYWDFSDDTEYRWTSLPRVSATKAKRPDHVIQINIDGANKFLVIESKNHAKDLEKKVGKRLTKYVDALFKITPTAYSEDKFDWKLYGGKKSPIPNPDSISGGAFVYKSLDEMKSAMKKGGLDFIFACEFNSGGKPTIGHVLLSDKSKFLGAILEGLGSQTNSGIEIQIH